MRIVLVSAVLFVLGGAAAAQERAEPPAARCFEHRERWAYDRARETLAAPGERFLDDLRACDSTFAAAVTEAIRYQVQDEEAKKFIHARTFVMAAYGVAWAILAISGILMWLRQRRLTAEIDALEARLRAAEKS